MRERYGCTHSGRACSWRVGSSRPARLVGELAFGRQRRSGDHTRGHACRKLPASEKSPLPEARPRPLGPPRRHGSAGHVKETLVVAVGEFGRSPRMGVSTRQQQHSRWPRPLALLLQRRHCRRRVSHAACSTASPAMRFLPWSPKEKPVHPNDPCERSTSALGIDPDMEIRNHLNQPRELVKGKIVSELFA